MNGFNMCFERGDWLKDGKASTLLSQGGAGIGEEGKVYQNEGGRWFQKIALEEVLVQTRSGIIIKSSCSSVVSFS